MKSDTIKKFERRAEYDLEILKAKIQIQLNEAEAQQAEIYRREIGLTHLEQDASVIFTSLQKAVVELTFYHEMDKNKLVLDKAALRIANTRKMYDSVCRKIFKICLKHGLKSEHMK